MFRGIVCSRSGTEARNFLGNVLSPCGGIDGRNLLALFSLIWQPKRRLQQKASIFSGPSANLIGVQPLSTGRAMLCNIGRIGDTILSNSILDSAFRTYAKVDYLCGKQNAELLRSDSRLNQVTVLRNSLAGFVAVAKAPLLRRYEAFIGLKDC